MSETEHVLVLGAGISGLTVADGFLRRGRRVTVVDSYPEPGGNHLSWNHGDYTFDIGTIYFPEHSPVRELVPNVGELWVRAEHSVQRITPSGTVRAYPLSLKHELFGRSPLFIAQVGAQIVAERLRLSRPRSVRSFVRYYIGERMLQESGLLFFLARFYNLPLDRIGFALAKRRMAWIADHAGLRAQARKAVGKVSRAVRGGAAAPDQWYARNWYVRPRAGFAAMYRPAIDRLRTEGANVRLGADLRRLERRDGRFALTTTDGTIEADRVVSTLPLELTRDLLGLASLEVPRSSALATLCMRFVGKRGFDSEVLYNFHERGAWKRLTMHSDFYGKADGWEYLAVEVTLSGGDGDPAALFDDFATMVRSVGLFDGELELIAAHVTRYAYPVYDQDSAAVRERALATLAEHGVETLGRQGSFEYIPVATEAMASARAHAGIPS